MITVSELYYGARDSRELTKVKKHLASLHQIAVDQETSEITLSLLETYALSHRLCQMLLLPRPRCDIRLNFIS